MKLVILLLCAILAWPQIIILPKKKPVTGGTETCGLTSIGASQDSGNQNYVLSGAPCVPTYNSTVTDAKVYIRAAGGDINIGIYDSDGTSGKPKTSLCVATTVAATEYSWNTLTFASTCSLTAGHTYWAMVNNTNAAIGYSYNGTGTMYYKAQTCCAMSSISDDASTLTRTYSIYLDLAY